MYEIINLICDADLATRFEAARDLRSVVTIENMKKSRRRSGKRKNNNLIYILHERVRRCYPIWKNI